MAFVDKINTILPLHFLVPAAIGVITLAAVGFLISNSTVSDIYVPKEKHVIKVEELWHYPIKSLGGIQVNKATIGRQGFEDDRTFCLVKIHRDKNTNEITVLETMYSGFNLQMVLFQAIVEDRDKEQLTYTGHSEHQIKLPLRPDVSTLEKRYLDMHGSACEVYDMGPSISAWFTKYLAFETALMYIGNNGRIVLGSGAPNGDIAIAKRSPTPAPLRRLLPSLLKTPTETITFQDIGQYLVVTKESNDEVSSRLSPGHSMNIHKFRPNIIVSGSPAPYDEDFWSRLIFPNNLRMDFGGTCWRCQAITVDLKTGRKAEGEEGEVWKRLNRDQRVDKGWKYGPVFGKYGYTGLGDVGRTIEVGERAVVAKRVREQPVFDWPLPKAVVAAFSG